MAMPDSDLIARLDALLPQTQCRQCGYAACRPYAEAMAAGDAGPNQCPPGGDDGARALSALLGAPYAPVDPCFGVRKPPAVAVIDEARCIGCTLCIKACPVDCIVGAPKQMHTVIDASCTGCELCLPACPVDCIALVPQTAERTGWAAWSEPLALAARERYAFHQFRVERERLESEQRLNQMSPSQNRLP